MNRLREATEHIKKLIVWRSYNYRATFSSEEGEKVLADLIAFSGYGEQSFVDGKPDLTAFNEGMRRLVTRIIKFTNMTPGDINRISEQYRTEERRYGAEDIAA